jgi:hypothetical protein
MVMNIKNSIKMWRFLEVYYRRNCRDELEKYLPSCLTEIILSYGRIDKKKYRDWNKLTASIRTIGSKPDSYIYFLKSDKYKEIKRHEEEMRQIEYELNYATVEEHTRELIFQAEIAKRNLDAFHLYLFNMNK